MTLCFCKNLFSSFNLRSSAFLIVKFMLVRSYFLALRAWLTRSYSGTKENFVYSSLLLGITQLIGVSSCINGINKHPLRVFKNSLSSVSFITFFKQTVLSSIYFLCCTMIYDILNSSAKGIIPCSIGTIFLSLCLCIMPLLTYLPPIACCFLIIIVASTSVRFSIWVLICSL